MESVTDPRYDNELEPQGAIWCRQDGESAKAFAAFVAYRNAGHRRSLRKVTETIFPGATAVPGHLGYWSRRWAWVDRARAYDAWVDRIARLEDYQAVVEMRRRHAKLASVMLARAAERLQSLDSSELTPSQLTALVEAGSRLERLARGEPTEITEDTSVTGAAARELLSTPDMDRIVARLEASMSADGALEVDPAAEPET